MDLQRTRFIVVRLRDYTAADGTGVCEDRRPGGIRAAYGSWRSVRCTHCQGDEKYVAFGRVEKIIVPSAGVLRLRVRWRISARRLLLSAHRLRGKNCVRRRKKVDDAPGAVAVRTAQSCSASRVRQRPKLPQQSTQYPVGRDKGGNIVTPAFTVRAAADIVPVENCLIQSEAADKIPP